MSNMHLTFKEYLNSKDKLISSLNKKPETVNEYTITKYCKISLGESIKDKTVISLKPNDIIKVKWLHESVEYKRCSSIKIENEKYISYWKPKKIHNWLEKNTKGL